MRKRPLRHISGWMILGMFVAQIATAAYPCPPGSELGAPSVEASAMPETCEGMGVPASGSRSSLCLEHCKADQRLVDNQSPAAGSLGPSAVRPLFVVADEGELSGAEVAAHARALVAHATAPPVFAASGRLRI